MYFSYHSETRKMPGMSGDVDEHPASSSAVVLLVVTQLLRSFRLNLHSNMIAIAINTIRTW